jgi:hypothetical protein
MGSDMRTTPMPTLPVLAPPPWSTAAEGTFADEIEADVQSVVFVQLPAKLDREDAHTNGDAKSTLKRRGGRAGAVIIYRDTGTSIITRVNSRLIMM